MCVPLNGDFLKHYEFNNLKNVFQKSLWNTCVCHYPLPASKGAATEKFS